MNKKKWLVVAIMTLFVVQALPAISYAQESSRRETFGNRFADWFATIGKSDEDRQQILDRKRAQRAERQAKKRAEEARRKDSHRAEEARTDERETMYRVEQAREKANQRAEQAR